MSGNNINIAPQQNEIEVSVFGPGYGECILIHDGDGEWFIIDSCIDSKSKEPAPLRYLHLIGVDYTKCVKQIIVSHWHDDHIRGLGNIVERCKSAELIFSNALQSKEFLTLVYAYTSNTMMKSTGVGEFKKILEVLKDYGKKPKWALADRTLWRKKKGSPNKGYDCSIYSLSPSDSAILSTQIELAKLMCEPDITKPKKPKGRVLALTHNRASIVLWIEIGGICLLLGSDMENYGNDDDGWSSVLNSTLYHQGKASVFKISHHGSVNGHHEDVWKKMLDSNPIAILTPYNRGQQKLPTQDDVQRICALTKSAYSTFDFRAEKIKGRGIAIKKTIKEINAHLKSLNNSTFAVEKYG
ncbi:MAG: MBL fold metallo-hydrolase [Nitrospirae bacterium]|nr:MBL fold metallo-hydrolase [Nitrospirota bacterium]